MKHPLLLFGVFLLGMAAPGNLHAQATLQDGFRNRFSYEPPASLVPGGVPPPGTGETALHEAYTAQGQSGTAFGGFAGKGYGTLEKGANDTGALLASSPVPDNFPHAGASGAKMLSAIIGRPLAVFAVTYNFGAEIPPPRTSVQGTALAADFYLPQPANTFTDAASTVRNPQFYFSPHAQKVFATQPGTIVIKWKERLSGKFEPKTYVIATSPVKPERTIFWTENKFKGPPVSLPQAKVNEVKIVYNSLVPADVPAPYETWDEGAVDFPRTKYKTVFFGAQDHLLHAYNVEGRVFVEYLGSPLGGGRNEHLGFEIVNVVKETAPQTRPVDIGEIVQPPEDPLRRPLSPTVNAGLGIDGQPYLYQHVAFAGTQRTLYAIRKTLPGTIENGKLRQSSNEVLIYWLEKGEREIEWPKEYAAYVFDWPVDSAGYSAYARPDSGTPAGMANSVATSVRLNLPDNPVLVYQDDPLNRQAVLATGGLFCTNVTPEDPTNRALLRFTNGNDIWFERVFSQLDPYYSQLDPVKYKTPEQVLEDPAQQVLFAQKSVTSMLDASGDVATGFTGISNVVVTNPNNPIQRFVAGTDYTVNYATGVIRFLKRNIIATPDAFGDVATGITGLSNVVVTHADDPNQVYVAGTDYTANPATGVISFNQKPYIVSIASLGTVQAGDTVSVRLISAWAGDISPEGSDWEVRSLSLAGSGDGSAVTLVDFKTGNGGFNAVNSIPPPDGPWTYDAPSGTWRAAGAQFITSDSSLSSPAFTVARTGALILKLKHRYNFEHNYDGGQLSFSVGSGPWQNLTDAAFTAHPYESTIEPGYGSILTGQKAFSGKSPGFDDSALNVTSARISFNTVTSARITYSIPTLAFGTVPPILNKEIGVRIEPAQGTGPETYGVEAPVYVGYVHQASGTAFSVDAYRDPFIAGFDEAAKGAIIGVNSLTDKNKLEVWWYKKSKPPGTTIKATYWPSFVQKYNLLWPGLSDKTDKIVLAENKGSDDLPSLEAAGQIYFQNDATKPGFNPNEEHALMLNGRAWALRDDLNIESSSKPYVLLQYTDADQRPSMRVFKVERGTFEYLAVAGVVLQAPMPLPLLPPPFKSDGSLASYEFQPDWVDPPAGSPQFQGVDETFAHYQKFTWTDRKGTVWVYRGPHGSGKIYGVVITNPGSGYLTTPSVTFSGISGTGAAASATVTGRAITGVTVTDNGTGYVNPGVTFSAPPEPGVRATGVVAAFSMRYFYQTQAGFFFPDRGANQPAVGTLTPYLRRWNGVKYVGDAVTGDVTIDIPSVTGRKEQPLDIIFKPEWPASAPELRVGETLTLPKLGLPSVRGQSSAELIYQQSIALDTSNAANMAGRQKSARLFDPTRAKKFFLAATATSLQEIPKSVHTSIFLGKTYFPNLPPHLSGRLYFDPAEGTRGALVFKGEFMNELFGEKYLQLNVMSAADVVSARGLIDQNDTAKDKWFAAIEGLVTTMETFVEDPKKRGTFIPVTDEEVTKRYNIINGEPKPIAAGTEPLIATVAPGAVVPPGKRAPVPASDLAEVYYSDTAVDSYSVSASGGGKGYVVLAVGNGIDTDLTPGGEPVSLQVFKVSAPLYRGELKVINSANPLDEKLTLQHTGDFAGHPEEYDFEWRYAPPVDGQPPRLYSFVRELIVPSAPAGSWRVINNPVSDPLDSSENYQKYRFPGATPEKEVNSVEITDGGSGYSSVPTVTFDGGGGKNAAGTAVIANGNVVKVILTRRGSGYLSAPSVTFAGGGGTGAAATVSFPKSEQPLGDTPMSVTVNDGNGGPQNGVSLPHAILRREFTAARRPMRLFLSLDLGRNTGAAVYLNGARVAAWLVPGLEDTSVTSVPATVPPFDPLPLVFEIEANTLKEFHENVLTAKLYSSADAGTGSTFNLRLEGSQEVENLTGWISAGLGAGEVQSTSEESKLNKAVTPATTVLAINGKNRHTIQGSSILTLSDNYFIMRYRAKVVTNAAYKNTATDSGWSKWTEPQLAEGWIKRALAGINPFQQRVKDLFNNAVNTDVSLIQQAGKRWEGDIPLNLANINDYGLIEIYETILRRGKMLSISGTPSINYGGANDALLLAAGYLSDLYMIHGNEAFADAANPTIAFNTDSAANFITLYGDVATSLFAFKGQEASVLDEELALLRGRDDFLVPGTKRPPVYNRLVWNYTRGIDAGEAIYALNYNIKDVAWDYSINPSNPAHLPTDGVVSAADAATTYPQGHGDAYGHYLTALTGYYGLLNNTNFSWTPRIEAVLVLGVPVSVDYQDERKFAAAAVALARTANQTIDLTYRKEFSASENAGWSQLHDTKPNAQTGMVRSWGTDDWACRGGQGALFHWATVNSLLPAVDPNPDHSGIQKIDRTTVPELAELAAQAAAMQQTLDNADAHLNPLGLGNGALAFDISPSEVEAGKTHFEQIYQRAVVALQNALSAFNNARGSTQFLRQQEDTLADKRNAIIAQEQAYTNQLIELYGSPYTDDIGPGKTYPQDYEGPDLYHSPYVEITENLGHGNFTPVADSSWTIYRSLDPEGLGMKGASATASVSGGKITKIDVDESGDDYEIAPEVIIKSSGDGKGARATAKLKDKKVDRITVTAGGSGYKEDETTVIIPPAGVGKSDDPKLRTIAYTLNKISGEMTKPDTWTGRRVSPGKMQTAVSDFLLARQNFFGALYEYDRLGSVMIERLRLYQSALKAHKETRKLMKDNDTVQVGLEAAEAALELVIAETEALDNDAFEVGMAEALSLPLVVGVDNDPSFAGRAAAFAAAELWELPVGQAKIQATAGMKVSELARGALERALEIDIDDANWKHENEQLKSDLRVLLQDYISNGQAAIDSTHRKFDQAQRDVYAVMAEGDRIQKQRLVFRQHAAALIQGYRTRDFAFRAFRNEALERYKALFDLSARYTYMAARAYDYETGLLDPNGNGSATGFYEKIMQARALGVITGGQPQFAGASTGDPGLSGVLAAMSGDWSVAKTRLGFNNPDRYRTTFSLRQENCRLISAPEGDTPWRDKLNASTLTNILDDPDVRRYAMQAGDPAGLAVPGIVLEFSSRIATGYNFFGQPLAGGDHGFSPTSFSTKIRSSGIAFKGYVGMDDPTTLGGALGGIGANSPANPNLGFNDPTALSATPYIYLIPAGTDSMRSPPLGDTSCIRTWAVEDQAIPLPFNIANSDYSTQPAWVTAASLSEPAFTLRKHQAFRAVPDGTVFSSAPGFTNSRLIGRSVWNSKWKIVIPGNTLLSDPARGLQIFKDTVKDIKLHLETYSYSGN